MKIHFILTLLFAGAGIARSASAFTATGSMITPRFGHIATLLQNGKVLIAGGYTTCLLAQPCIGPNSAELYDPITGVFRVTGAMHTTRPIGGILLPNGKVLFAESYLSGVLATIELYDPSDGEFKMAGTAATLALVASAALLNDGRVLLTGLKPPGFVSGAEIYDPVSETFRPIVNWPQDIGFVSPLAILPDGRVLFDAPALYDPITGTLTRVVAPGWFNGTPPSSLLLNGKVLLTGGNTDGGNVNAAELYDPATGFSATGSMSIARDGHTANLLPDGTILVAGGESTFNSITGTFFVTASADLYDPASGSFSRTGAMATQRFGHAAVVLDNGQVLITGGLSNPPVGPRAVLTGSSSAELYTPAVLIPAPVLFSLSVDGRGQGTIWDSTGAIVSASNPAIVGGALSMYTVNLAPGGVVPPQVIVGGKTAQVLYFGSAPGYPGYYQVNIRVPGGVAAGPVVPVRLTYLSRASNEVTIAVQ